MEKHIVIVDLDGTLAETHPDRHALAPSEQNKLSTPHWNAFNLAAHMDQPITDTINVVNALGQAGKVICILTGRSDIAADITNAWLKDNGVNYDALHMRSANDHRLDTIFKEEALRKIGLNQILCCFDDNQRVVKMMRSLDLTVYHVRHYDQPKIHEA